MGRPTNSVGQVNNLPVNQDTKALTGRTRPKPKWIVFETGDNGELHIRTLYGSKVIKDPQRAQEILRVLTELMDTDETGEITP